MTLPLLLLLTPAVDLPDAWGFRPPADVRIPAAAGGRNAVDAFVLRRLRDAGLAYRDAADRRTLARRVTFDLTGLPPTPAETAAFLADTSPNAYGKLVDRLLASPLFGEKAATWWLDAVRFAESNGFKADEHRPLAWRYRDYVINSLNADKPYDRFVREQIAGDELYPDDPAARVATGMHRHYPDESNAINLEQRRQEILNDITDTTSAALLGLSMGCCKCHDHKFDPLPQRDYYRFQAFFAAWWPARTPLAGAAARREYEERMAAWRAKTADLAEELEGLEAAARRKHTAIKRRRFPKEYARLLDVPESERSPGERQIAMMVAAQTEPKAADVRKRMSKELHKPWQRLLDRIKKVPGKPRDLPQAMALTDVGPVAPPTHLLGRGNWKNKGEVLQPGFPVALGGGDAAVTPRAATTGRRAALAEWLTAENNPLLARVIVNRLWQQHFGRGLVATPNDFGRQGAKPTHPRLLDWLAKKLIRDGWRLKPLHRLMVTSAAYRQASTQGSQAASVDPENKLLWRQNRQRLDGEALRDAMLAVAGRLNFRAGGPGVRPHLPAEMRKRAKGWSASRDAAERDRRSVYVLVKRNLRYPLFSLFDAPNRNETCARRFNTTTAPQSLMLLNEPLIVGLAGDFAGRVRRESAGGDVVNTAMTLALGRPATDAERPPLREYHKKHGLNDLCHAVLNLNEFIYID